MITKDRAQIVIKPLTPLTTIFIILKLTETISWSWWWVLSPIWIPLVVAVFTIIIVLLCVLFFTWLESR